MKVNELISILENCASDAEILCINADDKEKVLFLLSISEQVHPDSKLIIELEDEK